MAVTIPHLETLVQDDYQRLCEATGLTPLPRDIYEIIEDSQDRTPHGMLRSYPYAGYDQHVIYLPFHDLELEMFPDKPPPFLPQLHQWNVHFNQIWPKWRCDLWHEATHQYVDQILHQWTPGNRHDGPWFPATDQLAAALGVLSQSLQNVAWGFAVPIVGGGQAP